MILKKYIVASSLLLTSFNLYAATQILNCPQKFTCQLVANSQGNYSCMTYPLQSQGWNNQITGDQPSGPGEVKFSSPVAFINPQQTFQTQCLYQNAAFGIVLWTNQPRYVPVLNKGNAWKDSNGNPLKPGEKTTSYCSGTSIQCQMQSTSN
ncbi:MAG TPA: hypothetical protein VJK30_05370 [Coxiellaceae bacterium]|nr:MAG: hypothetical protein A3E81_01005 [Gammaproteobacteria bacterium RIFCSPHIGHO2_12_FULL_36_30]HLB56740.1 hypothetical protein [Coxiellaceae bacterium]